MVTLSRNGARCLYYLQFKWLNKQCTKYIGGGEQGTIMTAIEYILLTTIKIMTEK